MGKHGGGGHTPKMLNDNLKSKQFYRVIDLISEGPIEGPVDSQHLNSFLVNNTPITDTSGGVNIPGIAVAWREGSGNQTAINGLNFIEATTMVGLEVKQGTPIVRNVIDPDVTRIRFNIGVSGLVHTTSKGDQENTSVELAIEFGNPATGGWSTVKNVKITGKISGEYLEAHVVAAPANKPFDIRVRRVTPDSTTDTTQNGTVWNSYTEIIDDALSYPYSAIAGAIIDHDQYTDTPSRTYHLRGLIVDVPDNYDPIKRTYSGIWTGGWKQAWTNNPAWLFRELVTNKRFGLAKVAGAIDVDDGALYTLSQYCDQLVPTGYGTQQEPRLTLNAYITESTTARELLDKIAGMFRGMALWDGMRLTVLIDNPADPIAVISNANVIDGKFTYSSTKRSERYNAVVVSWCDPQNGWKTSKEYVSDDTLIARFGYKETTLEAFGCTSRGQAWRAGKWLIETARRETRSVKFQMGRDAIHFMPGDIIEVQDNNYTGARLGGRILSHAGTSLALDANVSSIVALGDKIGLLNASGRVDHYTIDSVNGNIVTLRNAPSFVKVGSVFVINSAKVSSRLFRIMTLAENDNNGQYTITAAQHDPHKQAVVDEGAVFEAPNDTLNGYRVPSVENIRIIDVNSPAVQVRAEWETATTTRGLTFELTVYNPKNKGAVVEQHTTDTFGYNFFGLPAGNYQLGIKAVNQMGMKGPEAIVNMNVGAPAKPTHIEWKEDIFAATLIPSLGASYSNDISFEYWMKGDGSTPVSKGGDVTTEADFLGRGAQWHLSGLKASTTYYVYVRSRNGFGASDFVEVSGQASDNIPGMIAVVDNAIRNSAEFGKLDADVVRIDASLNSMGTDLGKLEQTWQTAKADLDKDVQAFTNSISGINVTVTAADRKIDKVRSDLEASISAITGGGNATFQGLVNDVQQVKTDQASQLTALNAATTRMNGIDATVADQINLWRADDAVIATDVATVKATAAKNTADITTEQQARVAGDHANTERIDKMISTLPADQNHPDRKALMTTITQTETDADKALSLRIDNWQATNGDWQAKIDASTKAAVDGDNAITQRLDNFFVTGSADNSAMINRINNAVTSNNASFSATLTRYDARIAANTSDIQDEIQARSSADDALSQRITRMLSTTGTPSGDRTALLQTISSTSSTATDAVARRAAALEATVNGVPNDPKHLGLTARVDVLESVTSGPTGSVATRLSSLETFQFRAENNGLPANQQTSNAIAEAKKAGTDAQGTANAASQAAGKAQKDIDDYKKVSSGWGSRIQTLEQTGGTLNSADAQRITTLESFKATASKDGLPANAATTKAIADAKKAGTDAGTAAAGAQGTANTALQHANDAQARITTIEKTGATPTKVWTDKIDTHESTLKNLNQTISSTVQTSISTSVGTAVNQAMSAEWGVKTAVGSGNQRYVAGIQLGVTSDPNNHNAVSNFLIKADNFAIYNPNNGAAEFAFATKGGQTFIKSAFIENGSITTAHLGNVTIDQGQVTGLLQSSGWNGGAGKGWAFNRNGDFGIRTGAGAQRVEINGAGIRVYDQNGTIRVKIGQL